MLSIFCQDWKKNTESLLLDKTEVIQTWKYRIRNFKYWDLLQLNTAQHNSLIYAFTSGMQI